MKRREAISIGGSVIVGSILFSIWESCKIQPGTNWNPVFFDAKQAALTSALVDALLPKTSKPGGLDVNADVFIDRVINETYSDADKKSLMDEINEFDQKCKEKFGSYFASLSNEQKRKCLVEMESTSPKFNGKVWGTGVGEQKPVGFYRKFKSMAVWAYCTSEAIGKNELKYDPLPGGYHGCVPMSEIGKVWSL